MDRRLSIQKLINYDEVGEGMAKVTRFQKAVLWRNDFVDILKMNIISERRDGINHRAENHQRNTTAFWAYRSCEDVGVVLHVVASTLKPFISMSLYNNIHGFDVDATMCNVAVENWYKFVKQLVNASWFVWISVATQTALPRLKCLLHFELKLYWKSSLSERWGVHQARL